jgi:FixJ family two-component response regulator
LQLTQPALSSSKESSASAHSFATYARLILDLRLPGMSGLELQKQLATAQCRIPIVFVSAHDNPAFRRQVLRSGAVAFLGKPFNDETLLEAIHSAIKPGKPQ